MRNNLEGASEEIRLTMKPGTTKLGLTLADVNRQVRQAYFGEEVQRLARNGQDVRVKVRYPLAARRSIESLKNFRVRTSDGRELPLLSVADLEYAPGITRIQRWNGNRAARVSADLKENVRDDIMQDLDENFFPSGRNAIRESSVARLARLKVKSVSSRKSWGFISLHFLPCTPCWR